MNLFCAYLLMHAHRFIIHWGKCSYLGWTTQAFSCSSKKKIRHTISWGKKISFNGIEWTGILLKHLTFLPICLGVHTAIMSHKCVWYRNAKVIPTSETTNFQQTPLQKGYVAHLKESSGCIELAAMYAEPHS